MTLEPSRLPLLPLLEATPAGADDRPRIEGLRAALRADLQWMTDRPVTERLRLSARAFLDHRHGPRRDGFVLREYTDLPPGFNPRTLEWASRLRADPRYANASPETLVQVVLGTIRSGFTYTLTPGTYGDEQGRHAIDEFWLDRKQGFCEHFSTAFVVVMRALDVPARIVTGYQGMETEAQDGWYLVRNSHAHAWTEVWLEGRGWVRVDPTAAVAPERVVQSRALRAPAGVVAGAIEAVNPQLLVDLRKTWERVNNQWNQWVLGYSRSEQFSLLEHMGWRSPDWSDLAYLLTALMSGAALAGAAWAWWDRHRRDPWQRLAWRLARRLRKLDIDAQAHEGPRVLARKVRTALGPHAEALARRLEALDALRYGRHALARPSRSWWRDFARECTALASR
jgi:transglutaminase-like putative cysteine protease